MAEEIGKVYSPTVIADMPFPQEGGSDLTTAQTTGGGVYSPETTKDNPFPVKRTAVELLSTALNTRSKRILQEFQFTKSGALQIGEYEEGVSGDIRISPNGIVARDNSGNTTISIDGTTGDVIISGTLQSRNVLTGDLIVGNNGVIISGEDRTIIVNDGTYDRVLIGYDQNGF